MHWRDDGIILGTRAFGERGLIVEAMTAAHGRHLGLVRGGRSRRHAAALQPGNGVALGWRARLDEHLGTFEVEPAESRAARLMESALGLYGITLLAAHLRLLPEREPHRGIYEAALIVADRLSEPDLAPALMVRFELALLDALGFGLDLSACAATGVNDDLAYVSPKSGRAVSLSAGEPWKDRLLPLPGFLTGAASLAPDQAAIEAGFGLTGHFLDRDVWAPRGLSAPDAREGFRAAMRRALAATRALG